MEELERRLLKNKRELSDLTKKKAYLEGRVGTYYERLKNLDATNVRKARKTIKSLAKMIKRKRDEVETLLDKVEALRAGRNKED